MQQIQVLRLPCDEADGALVFQEGGWSERCGSHPLQGFFEGAVIALQGPHNLPVSGFRLGVDLVELRALYGLPEDVDALEVSGDGAPELGFALIFFQARMFLDDGVPHPDLRCTQLCWLDAHVQ
ncbi:MAG: hypothetical protein AB7T01_10170 [Acidithiobacillus sp.]